MQCIWRALFIDSKNCLFFFPFTSFIIISLSPPVIHASFASFFSYALHRLRIKTWFLWSTAIGQTVDNGKYCLRFPFSNFKIRLHQKWKKRRKKICSIEPNEWFQRSVKVVFAVETRRTFFFSKREINVSNELCELWAKESDLLLSINKIALMNEIMHIFVLKKTKHLNEISFGEQGK